jgi:hypothetical protein
MRLKNASDAFSARCAFQRTSPAQNTTVMLYWLTLPTHAANKCFYRQQTKPVERKLPHILNKKKKTLTPNF